MSWKQGNYEQLERAEEIARSATAAPDESKPWWQRVWTAIIHPGQALRNALVQWGIHSKVGYEIIGGLARATASMNDGSRNPVTARFA